MKSFLTKSLLGAAAFLCLGAANANVVTLNFENDLDLSGAPFAPLLAGNDYVAQEFAALADLGLRPDRAIGTDANAAGDASTILDDGRPVDLRFWHGRDPRSSR